MRRVELLLSGTASERTRAELAARDIALTERAFDAREEGSGASDS